MAIRAVRAAKDYQEAAHGLAKQLETCIGDSSGSVEYVLQTLFPLLSTVVAEICATKPENPSMFLALWLLERCCAPASCLEDLRQWAKTSAVENPIHVAQPQEGDPAETAGAPTQMGTIEIKPPPKPRPSAEAESILLGPKTRKLYPLMQRQTSSASVTSDGCSFCAPGFPEEAMYCSSCGRKRPGAQDDSRRISWNVAGRVAKPGEADNRERRVSIWLDSDAANVSKGDGAGEGAGHESDDDDEEEGASSAHSDSDCEDLATTSSPLQQLPADRRRPSSDPRKRRFTVAVGQCQVDPPPMTELLELLRGVAMFKEYTEGDLQRIANISTCVKFDADEIVAHCGLAPEALHVVVGGVAGVAVPQLIGRLGRGEAFGEEALNLGGASLQQVTANTGLICLRVTASDFKTLGIKHGLKKCDAVKMARWSGSKASPTHPFDKSSNDDNTLCPATGRRIMRDYRQTKADRDMITTALMSNKVLSEVMQLTEEQFDMITESVYLIDLPKDEVLIRKGDRGTALFVVQEGLLDVHLDERMCGEFKIRSADSFGELALLYDTPRMATITSTRDCKIWVLVRQDFRAVMRMNYRARIEKYLRLMENIPCFESIRQEGKVHMLAGALEECFFLEGEDVCVQGEDRGLFFIIYEGECEVLRDGERVRMMQKGDWLGEQQVMSNIAAEDTVRVISGAATILGLDNSSWLVLRRAIYEMRAQQQRRTSASGSNSQPTEGRDGGEADRHRGRGADTTENYAEEFLKKRMSRMQSRSAATHFARRSVACSADPSRLEDHEGSPQRMSRVGALGEGAFGSVVLMQDRITKKMFALKALFKEQVKTENMCQCVRNERTMMMLLDSDFITRVYRTYQDSKHYFFVLEAVLGGELFEIYGNNNFFGKIQHAMFYIACVILGLQHMHSKRVIYRDLKLENCLLSETGYLKLTDLGIAKLVIGRTYTVCGTADYFAPETLRQTGHNRAADWWACGVLLFIMMSGRSPFDAPEVTQIYKNIMKGFSKVIFPPAIPSDITDVIKSLCRKKPEERLTMQKGGVDNLKAMPFFTSFDWDALGSQQMCPPFTPGCGEVHKAATRQLSKVVEFDPAVVREWDGTSDSPKVGRPRREWSDFNSVDTEPLSPISPMALD